MRLLLPLLWVPGWAACAAAPPGPHLAPEPPRPWRLVDVAGPAGRVLVLERDEDPEPVCVEVRLSRPEAAVGDVVEAEVRLTGARGRRRINVRPARPGVRVIGASEIIVDGEGSARVRFTAETAGPGGVVVTVGAP